MVQPADPGQLNHLSALRRSELARPFNRGVLPESTVGAVVGVADRLDTISGCFAIKQEPTGAADPFALRRHSLAIIRIIEKKGWEISLGDLIGHSLKLLPDSVHFEPDHVFARVLDFFKERYKNLALRSGYSNDLIEAVIGAEFDLIHQLRPRLEHLARFKDEAAEFEPLVLTSKRVSNILKKQKRPLSVQTDLFKEPCEVRLWESFQKIHEGVDRELKGQDYYQALKLTAELREPVDALFDGVEILTQESRTLQENRVALLQIISKLFLNLADFSKFPI